MQLNFPSYIMFRPENANYPAAADGFWPNSKVYFGQPIFGHILRTPIFGQQVRDILHIRKNFGAVRMISFCSKTFEIVSRLGPNPLKLAKFELQFDRDHRQLQAYVQFMICQGLGLKCSSFVQTNRFSFRRMSLIYLMFKF